MASVNDVDTLFPEKDAPLNSSECPDWAKDRLEAVAKTSWHPVSEPPTEADGDDNGLVIIHLREGAATWIVLLHWRDVAESEETGSDPTQWARIRDVVLLPPEN